MLQKLLFIIMQKSAEKINFFFSEKKTILNFLKMRELILCTYSNL